jgi:hypothetical protein
MLESEEYKKWIHELFLNPRRVFQNIIAPENNT